MEGQQSIQLTLVTAKKLELTVREWEAAEAQCILQ